MKRLLMRKMKMPNDQSYNNETTNSQAVVIKSGQKDFDVNDDRNPNKGAG